MRFVKKQQQINSIIRVVMIFLAQIVKCRFSSVLLYNRIPAAAAQQTVNIYPKYLSCNFPITQLILNELQHFELSCGIF